ncbi:MAG TPA: MFS transporter [Bacteroidales bacterium]|nr:MFS transporter [Bacteroidales bacterium]HKL32367.1 MFS transporter [Tangfeifania sp.]
MTRKNINPAFASVPVFLAFLSMGFGDVAGTLTDLVKDEYHLSNFLAGFVPMSGFIMFGILPVPFSLIMARQGKKKILALGLIVALLGLVIPLFLGFTLFSVLLLSILLLGAGAALLQVAGNPIMRDVSPQGKYSRNLSFGQFVKAIGSLSGALLPAAAATWWGMDWKLLFPVYAIAIGITTVILLLIPIREKAIPEEPPTLKSCLALLGKPGIGIMVLAIFLYVGAEVGMASKLPSFLENNYGLEINKLGVASVGLFFLTIMLGRFLGGVILNWIKAPLFLLITTILALAGIGGLFLNIQALAIVSIVLIGLGFANIFPLIFSITVDKHPEYTNELSGLMVTAIIGGAVLPVIMGVLADLTSVGFSFVIPAAAILYAFFVAVKTQNS